MCAFATVVTLKKIRMLEHPDPVQQTFPQRDGSILSRNDRLSLESSRAVVSFCKGIIDHRDETQQGDYKAAKLEHQHECFISDFGR